MIREIINYTKYLKENSPLVFEEIIMKYDFKNVLL
jgi:hypothetical protein